MSWVVKASGGDGNWHYSVVHDGDYDDVERTLANVTLMAAAPDLLAACETILAELEEQNAQEGMALTITEKAEWLTPGLRAMVAAIRSAKCKSDGP